MNILLTGGTGYIGAHTAVELINAGHNITIVDNLSTSNISVINNVEIISKAKPKLYLLDLRDKKQLEQIFKQNNFDAVIHFAGFKSVAESVKYPLRYYDNNVISTIYLLELVEEYKIPRFIFSSSATVYGIGKNKALTEADTSMPVNPYAATKNTIEEIMKFMCVENNKIIATSLRYFNPISAHKSGLIGDSPSGIPNNLLPLIGDVASGVSKKLYVFGNDYDTKDGTCVRDYIHIIDLARAHLSALENNNFVGFNAFNIGTGKGSSVLDVIAAFEKATGIDIPYEIVGRRARDVATYYADPSKANKLLKWEATLSLEEMCQDYWNFRNKQ